MSERNPYAPSQASLAPGTSSAAAPERPVGVWRDGSVMVMLPGAEIPHRCVKCNEPADEPTKTRTVSWYNPWLLLLILAGIIVWAIVVMFARKHAVVSPGLCAEHKRRRRNVIAAAWIGVLAGILLMYAGISTSSSAQGAIGFVATLISIVLGIAMGRVVHAARIDDQYVRLKGCGEPFLETLPDFPY
jgi:hypothetical protein